jgi:hypothetical protein
LLFKLKKMQEDNENSSQIQVKAEEERYSGINNAMGGLRTEILDEIKIIIEDYARLSKELEQTKAVKADSSQVFSLIQMKSEELALIREELNYHSNQIKSKASYIEFEQESKSSRESLETLKRDFNHKFDKKVNDLQEAIALRSEKDEFFTFVEKQEAINETICSENTIARWVLSNRKTISGEVYWDQNKVNTCPENFIWQDGASEILVGKAGCYEVSLAFYAERKPIVQVFVNNQLAFSLINVQA